MLVPATKPYISFIGNESSETAISWHTRASDRDARGQIIGTLGSATVAVESDYFCARGITFEVIPSIHETCATVATSCKGKPATRCTASERRRSKTGSDCNLWAAL